MTITELIERLEDVRDDEGDIEVAIAYQPTWPLGAGVANVGARENHSGNGRRCWIAATQGDWADDGYAPRSAWDEYEEEEEW